MAFFNVFFDFFEEVVTVFLDLVFLLLRSP
jgi:hypothetical protein